MTDQLPTPPSVFTFHSHPVRVVLVDGAPWWVLADACAALGIANSRDAAGRISADDVGETDIVDSQGRTQKMTIINEPGVYELVFRSNRPEAKDFRHWLTHEVLPEIRRTGAYGGAGFDLETALETALAAERRRKTVEAALLDAQEQVERSTAQVAELAPKAEVFDAYLQASSSSRLVRQVAQLLSEEGHRITESQLRHFLLDQRLVYTRPAECGARQYLAYAAFATHFEPVERLVEHIREGLQECAHYTLYVRPSGVTAIRRRLERIRQVDPDQVTE